MVFSMCMITRRKFKGVVDWSAEHAEYVTLWNKRQALRMYYLSGFMHRLGPYKEYLMWLHQHSRFFLKPTYTKEHIAHLPNSDDDNEIIDEYDTITRQVSYPGSERGEPKLPYVCPGCSQHTYDQQ
jgi:hypothetical protein